MDNLNMKIKEKLVIFCQKNKIKRKHIAAATAVTTESVRVWLSFDKDTLPPLSVIAYLRKNHRLDVNDLID